MKHTKYLVIGAGVTGLGFANYIKDDFLILESSKSAGGFCKTFYIDDYIWDYAGHFFHFNNEEIKAFFRSKMSENEIVSKTKNTKIYFDDRFIDFPFQKNIHQLPKQEFIDCLYDLFNKTEKEKYDCFLDMLYGKFGESITNLFLKPYNEKLYACDLNNLDSEAMGRFFPYANLKEIINNMKISDNSSYNQKFLYPKKGAQAYVDVLLKEIPSQNIEYNNRVLRIDIDNKKVYTEKGEYSYEYLINTISLKNFLKICNYNDTSLSCLTSNKVLVFNLGFDKKSYIDDMHWLYVPQKDINFYRLGFYDNILDSNKLSMYVEIGYKENEDIDIEEQLKLTLENLKKMNVISDHKLMKYNSIIMDPAYVHISKESNKETKHIFKKLSDQNIYSVGRYGGWKYCSIEDCMLDAKYLAEVFNK